MPTGGAITILLLLPNLLWMFIPAHDQPAAAAEPAAPSWRVLEIVEWVGRVATLVIPFFYHLDVQEAWHVAALVMAVVALLFYYVGWARYFVGGRRHALLFAPLAGVPVPLAISPIVYLLGASALLGSWPLAVATLVLASAHLPISWRDYRLSQGGIA